jgi:hypothetical protein
MLPFVVFLGVGRPLSAKGWFAGLAPEASDLSKYQRRHEDYEDHGGELETALNC